MKNHTFPGRPISRLLWAFFLLLLVAGFNPGGIPGLHAQILQSYNPKLGFPSGATIEEGTIVTKLLGAHCEISIYLTVSARGSLWYGTSDLLDFRYKFDLPRTATVHDAWVWVGDTIVKAILEDGRASNIAPGTTAVYQKDLLTLRKEGLLNYNLSAFSLSGTQKKRLKISYLLPVNWRNGRVSIELPVSMFGTTRAIPKLTILAWTNRAGQSPTLSDGSTLTSYKPDYPNLYQASFTNFKFPSTLLMRYEVPMPKGYQVSVMREKNDEGFYQVSFLPQALGARIAPRKIAILLDYEKDKSLINAQVLLSDVRDILTHYLTAADSFNLFFSNSPNLKASDKWIPGDQASINAVLDNFTNPFSNKSNSKLLLLDAFEFIRQNGSEGQILMLSNANNLSYENSNVVYGELLPAAPSGVPVYSLNYFYKPFETNFGTINLLTKLSNATKGYFGMTAVTAFITLWMSCLSISCQILPCLICIQA